MFGRAGQHLNDLETSDLSCIYILLGGRDFFFFLSSGYFEPTLMIA